MSRAFVRDGDTDFVEDFPDRLISTHPNDVTETGMAQIEAALAEARGALATAQASANRASIAAAARNIRYWSARRASARVLPSPANLSEVRFGVAVTIVRDNGREQTFRIVGEDEADPAKGSISHVSPLARALLGKSIGDIVKTGNHKVEIASIN